MAAYYTLKALGVLPNFILHCNTRTGIPETSQFCREFAGKEGIPFIEADARQNYENYVLRKGFFGRGKTAHGYAYHMLKQSVINHALSQNIRQGKRGRNILLINGARASESDRRMTGIGTTPIRRDGTSSNFWVSVINHFTKNERDDFLSDCRAEINPVAKQLCRSGECLCGTMQNQAVRDEASYFYPEWGKWLDNLESKVKKTHGWGWGEDIPLWAKERALYKQRETNGQLALPMCQSCLSEPVWQSS